MPGSPYLDKPPKGLLTWPRLIMIVLPTFTAITAVAIWQGLLLLWLGTFTAAVFVAAYIRR
ncbi:MAG: hypothetical protein QF707_00220 [Candidatus Poseidoniaceae archaeon]|nr:hypothetical protein [Candidatus Poseidoniaceae archaeon]MDP7202555.1 hypothetical protein [Candidatus Poseidoniaceae archaeon]